MLQFCLMRILCASWRKARWAGLELGLSSGGLGHGHVGRVYIYADTAHIAQTLGPISPSRRHPGACQLRLDVGRVLVSRPWLGPWLTAACMTTCAEAVPWPTTACPANMEHGPIAQVASTDGLLPTLGFKGAMSSSAWRDCSADLA